MERKRHIDIPPMSLTSQDCYMLFQGYEYITKLWYNQFSKDAMQAMKSKMKSRIQLEEKTGNHYYS
jgi:hypothetical protein